MFFKIGLFDTIFVANATTEPAVKQQREESITVVAQQPCDTPGIADQVIARARVLLKLKEQPTDQALSLFNNDWLLGYIAGLATAAAADHYITDEIEVLGLMTRSVGELAGGGLSNKVTAHEKIIKAWGESAFEEGSRQGKADWPQHREHH